MNRLKAMALETVKQGLLRKYDGYPCFLLFKGKEMSEEEKRDLALCEKLGIKADTITIKFVRPDEGGLA